MLNGWDPGPSEAAMGPCRRSPEECGTFRTRRAFVERYADQKVMIIGTHFCDPTSGWIVRDGAGWKLSLEQKA